MAANLLLCLAIVTVVYGWYRIDFRVPASLPISARAPRVMVQLGGWVVIVLLCGYSLGGMIGGNTQVAKFPRVIYAHRDVDPGLFWRQIALQTGAGLFVGLSLIGLARARSHTSAT